MKQDAVDALIEHKKEFKRLADRVNTIYSAFLPDPIEKGYITDGLSNSKDCKANGRRRRSGRYFSNQTKG